MSNQAKVQVNDAETGGSVNVTPKAPKPAPTTEKPGVITSDSLAAESLSSGGSFAGGKATADSVPSASSTASTTDTSAARTIEPAASKASRGDDDAGEGGVALGGGSGGGDGGAGASKGDEGVSGGSGSTGGGVDKPKGDGITEGGFDENAPNASFNNEIGTEQDPGRFAETKFEQSNARSGDSVGYAGANDTEIEGGKGGFENLKEQSA